MACNQATLVPRHPLTALHPPYLAYVGCVPHKDLGSGHVVQKVEEFLPPHHPSVPDFQHGLLHLL